MLKLCEIVIMISRGSNLKDLIPSVFEELGRNVAQEGGRRTDSLFNFSIENKIKKFGNYWTDVQFYKLDMSPVWRRFSRFKIC